MLIAPSKAPRQATLLSRKREAAKREFKGYLTFVQVHLLAPYTHKSVQVADPSKLLGFPLQVSKANRKKLYII